MQMFLTMEQGSQEWFQVRLGLPTASQVKRIVTPGGKLSAERNRYMAELIVEWARGESTENFENEFTQRGRELEGSARQLYELQTGLHVAQIGIIIRDTGGHANAVGYSPDGVLYAQAQPPRPCGLIEIKCVNEIDHLISLSSDEVPSKYMPQLQGGLWVTGALWIDFVSYHPDWPLLIKRVEPDAKYHAALDKHMPVFVDEMIAGRRRLRDLGVTWDAVDGTEADDAPSAQ